MHHGSKAMAEALKVNKTSLQTLHLRGENNIDDNGAKQALVDALWE